ncbi:MAG: hypothetical protein JSS86_03325 [Cyanobacteria bacterium SZAS LIN-2]|nr:hypothetical protein [Cyanobacteria bacterium SZAS LIN-2]
MQNLGNISGIDASGPVDNERGSAASASTDTHKGWVLSPLLDYLFVSGGLVWLLYAVTFFGITSIGADPASKLYGSILYWGAFLITDAHGPATLVRVFESKTTPKKVRYLVAAWAAILFAVACVSVSHKDVTQAFVKITLLWVVQHYIAQTFGVVLIYCLKRDYKLSDRERFIFQGLMRSLMYFVLIRMLTVPAYGRIENFMGLEVPFWGPLPPILVDISQWIFVGFSAAFIYVFGKRFLTKKEAFPLPGLLAIVTVAAVTLSPRNGFYLLGVTFYHASQYLAITFSYFLKEKSLNKAGDVPVNLLPHLISKPAIIYFAAIVAVGYVSTFTLPVYMIKNGLPDALVLCTVYALLNCHHFLADALIWRIRDPKVRKLLV